MFKICVVFFSFACTIYAKGRYLLTYIIYTYFSFHSFLPLMQLWRFEFFFCFKQARENSKKLANFQNLHRLVINFFMPDRIILKIIYYCYLFPSCRFQTFLEQTLINVIDKSSSDWGQLSRCPSQQQVLKPNIHTFFSSVVIVCSCRATRVNNERKRELVTSYIPVLFK